MQKAFQPFLAAGLCQLVEQAAQHARLGIFAAERRPHAILGRQVLHVVAAGGRVQQIGGQLCVKYNGFALAPGLQRGAQQRLCIKTALFAGLAA